MICGPGARCPDGKCSPAAPKARHAGPAGRSRTERRCAHVKTPAYGTSLLWRCFCRGESHNFALNCDPSQRTSKALRGSTRCARSISRLRSHRRRSGHRSIRHRRSRASERIARRSRRGPRRWGSWSGKCRGWGRRRGRRCSRGSMRSTGRRRCSRQRSRGHAQRLREAWTECGVS